MTKRVDKTSELWGLFKEGCDFDTSEIPKHGKGYVTPFIEYEGVEYQLNCELVWDYSWGIEWEYIDPDVAFVEVVPKDYSILVDIKNGRYRLNKEGSYLHLTPEEFSEVVEQVQNIGEIS